jgi:hypothetical protein
MHRKNWLFFAALVLSLAAPMVAMACPNCKSMIEDKGAAGTGGSMAGGIGGNMAAGYYYSILFMLAVLFTMVGTLFFVIRREARQVSPDISSLEQ